MIYRTAPFLMTLNHPYPDFKVTPLFDAEYIRNGTRYRHCFNGILIWTYTRPTEDVISNDLWWSWVTWRNMHWHEASRGLSATAELIVYLLTSCISADTVTHRVVDVVRWSLIGHANVLWRNSWIDRVARQYTSWPLPLHCALCYTGIGNLTNRDRES